MSTAASAPTSLALERALALAESRECWLPHRTLVRDTCGWSESE